MGHVRPKIECHGDACVDRLHGRKYRQCCPLWYASGWIGWVALEKSSSEPRNIRNDFAENCFGYKLALLTLGTYVLSVLIIRMVLLPVPDLFVAHYGLAERMFILNKIDVGLLRTTKLSRNENRKVKCINTISLLCIGR